MWQMRTVSDPKETIEVINCECSKFIHNYNMLCVYWWHCRTLKVSGKS